MLLQESLQFFEKLVTALMTLFQYQKGLGDLTFVRIGETDHTRLRNRRVLFQGLFHFGGADTVAGTLDHVVFAGDKANVAVFSHEHRVSHLVPANDHALALGVE